MSRSNDALTFWDFNGNYETWTVEEVMARRLNNWKGWYCSAGYSSLYIDFDGDIYRGTCRVGGPIGNIYSGYQEQKKWVKCTKAYCMCGADMVLPKVKVSQYREKALFKKNLQPGLDPEAVTSSDGAELINPIKIVNWDIGRRCNFDCSYCIPTIHNKTDKFKTYDEMKIATDMIVEKFCQGEKAKFYFAGGEPTIYPKFLKLVQGLREQGHEISVTTNGSQKADYYAELIKVANICLSVHFEFAKDQKIIENVRKTVRTVMRSQIQSQNITSWFGLKLMVPPGVQDRAVDLAKRLYSINGFSQYAVMGFHPIWRPDQPETLYDYTENELKFFKKFNDQESIDFLMRSEMSRRIRTWMNKNPNSFPVRERDLRP